MTQAIHQIVAGYTNGDAISNESRVMRSIFRKWGHSSEIYCEEQSILPQLRNDARGLSHLKTELQPNDIVLLHLSMGTDGNRIFKELQNPRVILYHNVTPARFYHSISRRIAIDLERGHEQVAGLQGCADLVLADSAYNARELVEMGYGDVGVLPLILDLAGAYTEQDRKILREFDDGRTNILFVGRCAPNKKLEDALLAFAHYQKFVNANSRFIHVGSYAGTERYHAILRTMIKDLQIDQVIFAGPVPQPALNAWFAVSDLFLSMSEHEGFCIPLLEAMIHDIPDSRLCRRSGT